MPNKKGKINKYIKMAVIAIAKREEISKIEEKLLRIN